MRVAICDKDRGELTKLFSLLEKSECVQSVYFFSVFFELERHITSGNQFQVVFVNVDWEREENGVERAAWIQKKSPDTSIIFLTEKGNSIIQKIFLKDINVCGYLEKPIQEEYVNYYIQKIWNIQKENEKNLFFIKNRQGIFTIAKQKIYFVESMAHKVRIYTKNRIYECVGKLDDIENRMPSNFVRCHKSFLVNMDWIDSVSGHSLQLRDEVLSTWMGSQGRKLNVSRTYEKDFKERYLMYLKNRED